MPITKNRTTVNRTLVSILLLLLLAPLLAPTSTTPARAQSTGNKQASTLAPKFIVGANYEGPVDRAWAMWEPDKFDPGLIAQDFTRANSVGITMLRIFVQTALRDDINNGDFSKLDTVLSLAEQHNLKLLLTFTDWAEPNLPRAADLDRRIAAHLAGNPTIFGYDVKNEPQFTDIAGAIYPTGTTVPLQSPDLIRSYGEIVSRASIPDYRKNSSLIPARMTDEQAYAMANYYELYKGFLSDSSAWVGKHPSTTTLDYMDSPDAAKWGPYLSALDTTLSAWVNTQADALRQGDPGRPLTVGYSNIILAKLPSNRRLDFGSVHRFPAHGYSGLNTTFLVLDNLQRTFAPQPYMLEEFGYPGQTNNGNGGVTGFDPRTTSNLEAATWLYLYTHGFIGGAKWMLNNFPQGYDPAQNTFGMFDNSGQPKITAQSLGQLSPLFAGGLPTSMTYSGIKPDSASAVQFSYASPDTVIAGGRVYTGTFVSYVSDAPGVFIASRRDGAIMLYSTTTTTATLSLPSLLGVATSELGRIALTAHDASGALYTPSPPSLNGDILTIPAMHGLHTYRLTAVPVAFEDAGPQPSPDSIYFPQTHHNVSAAFLTYWQKNGALSIFGYPISEPFLEGGYTVQYFERARFELHPENTPPNNVLLSRLGVDLTSTRVFPRIDSFESVPDHIFFPETGHSLNYAFLSYWQRNGGLALFGYPISEEISERSAVDGKNYTVQYFERARFEYHPEYKGTSAEVLLGLLGINMVQAKGWTP